MQQNVSALLTAVLKPQQQGVLTHFEASAQTVTRFQQQGIVLDPVLTSTSIKRQAEFLAGRWCAYHALASLGMMVTDIPMTMDRMPQWPASTLGAISHRAGCAAALVGWRAHYQAIGLDIETIQPTRRVSSLAHHVLDEAEAALYSISRMARALWLTFIFSAKESLFKALYPGCLIPFYFHDARVVALAPETGEFGIVLKKALLPYYACGEHFVGQYAFDQHYVVTALSF